MSEKEKNKEKTITQNPKKIRKAAKPEVEENDERFDFGGISKDIPFKRNIGCGG
jgi:hypothetical protein